MEVEKKSVNGLGIASLVFGIVGILTICGCGIGFFFGLIGTILGILGLTVLKRSGKGLAIAGTIVSGVALVFGSIWMFLYIPKHNSKSTSEYAAAAESTTNSSANSTGSSSASAYEKPNSGSSSYTSDADIEADTEALEESWNDVKDSFSDIFSEAWDEAIDEYKEGKNETSDESNSGSTSSNNVTPELKEFCDSYEAFMDQYINVMESVDKDTPEFMTQYADLLEKMADFEEKAAYYTSIEDDMSDADYAYYTASMLRIQAKLIEFSTTY